MITNIRVTLKRASSFDKTVQGFLDVIPFQSLDVTILVSLQLNGGFKIQMPLDTIRIVKVVIN